MMRRSLLPVCAGLLLCGCAAAQPQPAPPAEPTPAEGQAQGSTAFCLFELPGSGGTRKLVNLGIVQYVEVAADELRIYYGGGNLGSGHDARIAVRSAEDGRALLQRMLNHARACAGAPATP
jgi:hypothetical protein